MTGSDRSFVGYAVDRKNQVAQSYIRREPIMKKTTLFVGLDVHAKTINVAVAETGRDGEVRSIGIIANTPDAIRKKMRRLGKGGKKLRVCYEAGPCGYVIYWQLTSMGIECEVIAPSLIPKKPGDRVKTDRRDALALARNHRSGDLTPVWVPDRAHEALRDLVRGREAIKKDLRSARHRLSKLLLKHGVRNPTGSKNWSHKHMRWLKTLSFEEFSLDYVYQDYRAEVDYQSERLGRAEAAIDTAIENSPENIKEVVAGLQFLRGIAKITAVGLVAEIGQFSRFDNPSKLMAYVGSVPSEYSTGGPGKRKQGGITRMGNSHLRRLITESAWNYRFRPYVNDRMKKSHAQLKESLTPEVKQIAWKGQHRLCGRYRSLMNTGKPKQVTVTAVGRELLGFVWAVATFIESKQENVAASKAA
jgi:transposase